jgi:hypothetical protein
MSGKKWCTIAVLSSFFIISVIVIFMAALPAQAQTAILTPDGSGNIRYQGTGTPGVSVDLAISATVSADSFTGNSVELYGVQVQSPYDFSIEVSPVTTFEVSGRWFFPIWVNLGGTVSNNVGSYARSGSMAGTYDIKIDATPADSVLSITITSMYVPDGNGDYTAVFNTENIPDGVYTIKQDGVEVAKAYVGVVPYTLDLYEGWNLICIPLTLQSNDLSDIFPADVMSDITDVWGWDESVQNWEYYSINPNDYFYQFYPKITGLETGRAYWVRMEGTASVTVAGTVPSGAPDSPVALVTGWNCVGLTDMSQVAVTTMYPVATDVWGWDPVEQDWIYYSINPDDYFYQFYPKINNIMPGNGYWVRME